MQIFKIPKKNGSFRKIYAPDPEEKEHLRYHLDTVIVNRDGWFEAMRERDGKRCVVSAGNLDLIYRENSRYTYGRITRRQAEEYGASPWTEPKSKKVYRLVPRLVLEKVN